MQLAGPAAILLQQADQLVDARHRIQAIDLSTSTATVRVAVSDDPDPRFVPELVSRGCRGAPRMRIDLLPLSANVDDWRDLAFTPSLANEPIDFMWSTVWRNAVPASST